MSSLFGGSTPQVQFTPSGFTNPAGFGVSGGGRVWESPTLASNIGGLQSTFGQQAGALGGLASTVQPGFSQFRKAGLQDITNAFRSNLSNLKQNLAQRGVAGSSFGNASISQAYATEAQNKADFEAQSYIEELNAQYQLIQAQYQAAAQQFSTAINQSNIESNTAAQLTSSNNAAAASVAQSNAELQARSQAGAGLFAGLGLSSLGSWAAGGFAGPGGATLMDLITGAAVLV